MARQAMSPPEQYAGAGRPSKASAPAALASTAKSSIWRRLLGRNSTASEPSRNGFFTKESPSLSPTTQSPQTRPGTSTPLEAAAPVLATALAPAPAPSNSRHCSDSLSFPHADTNFSSTGDSSAISKTNSDANRRPVREVVPRLPRTQTLARQQSELRQNLVPILPTHAERRAVSADRRLASNVSSVSSPGSVQPLSNPRASAPALSHSPRTSYFGTSTADAHDAHTLSEAVQFAPVATSTSGLAFVSEPPAKVTGLGDPEEACPADAEDENNDNAASDPTAADTAATAATTALDGDCRERSPTRQPPLGDMPGSAEPSDHTDAAHFESLQYEQKIRDELENVWILNLSMHFRDKSRREKFFVTYRQQPNLTRRVTISLDYRNAPENSLEKDLSETKLPRDKNEMIYEAIRESLADIQFYDTVTNLKLQTTDGRLHVHVVEDVTEIIHYPSRHIVQHLSCHKVREQDVKFDSHMSGFVYKVLVDGQKFIKKEIPGPDSVDEFLYEINALNFLRNSRSVIELYGVVVSDDDLVKGLLISYAEQGALIDAIYDSDHSLPWLTRMKWARQIVRGLSEIHEAGFVQGDFTLSNIVIDDDGNAKIIDINRRGCPVGWEPPEATPLIQSGQQINMYIGVKSDLYQLGMVLWALATQYDNPEAHGRPLILGSNIDVPEWYRVIVETCLAEDPRVRAQARQLLTCFPAPSEAYEHFNDSGEDEDEWLEDANNPDFYAHSVPSGSFDYDSTSLKYHAGIEGHAFEDSTRDDADSDRLSQHEDNLPVGSSSDDLAPHIKSITPHNEWSYVDFGGSHTSMDPPTERLNEPYRPTRGRSPPSFSRRSTSWAKTSGPANDQTRGSGSESDDDYERESFPGTLEIDIDDRTESAVVEEPNGEQPLIGLSPDISRVTKQAKATETENGTKMRNDEDTNDTNDDACSKTSAKGATEASGNLSFENIQKKEQEHLESTGPHLPAPDSDVRLVFEESATPSTDLFQTKEADRVGGQEKAVHPVYKEVSPYSLDLSNEKSTAEGLQLAFAADLGVSAIPMK